MSKKIATIVCALFLLLLCSAFNLSSAAELTIPDMTAPIGSVQIPVNVDQAEGIAGFQLTATYDTDVLNCTGASAGSLTGGWVILPNTNVSGQITVGGFSPTLTPLGPGSGSLVTLLCTVLQETPSNICLSSWTVTNSVGTAINSCSDACDCGVLNPGECGDNSQCDDGDVCNGAETCDVGTGICVAGTPLNCDDGNVCTDDSCDPASGCVHTNNIAVSCNDNDACTTADTCSGGVCVGGPAPNCDDGNVCTDDSCDPASGCVHTNNTASCNDNNACTTVDTCSGGICVGGSALNCDDGNVCTDDSCDPASGCVHTNNTASCNDNNACTTADTCSGGSCVGGPALDCDDANLCTTDSCAPLTGCVNVPVQCPVGQHCDPADGQCKICTSDANCDDGNLCNGIETCSAGSCVPGTPPNCDDGNVCTDDSCDPASGCVHTNNTASCNDNNACTTVDTCSGGICVGGSALNCDDGNVCTDDSCDPASGCVHTNNTASCNDNNACTTADTCSGGVCVGGPALDCDDANLCTTDSCAPLTGCVNVPVECPAGQQCDPADGQCKTPPGKTVSIPDDLSGCVGEVVSVPVNVDDATGIAGFQCTVTYDPAVLDCTEAASGDLTEGWLIQYNAIEGQIGVAGIDDSLVELPGGAGSLTVISCQVTGDTGMCTDLNLVCTLTDSEANEIPSTADQGQLCVEDCAVIPATVDIDPATLNIKTTGKDGKYITAYIELTDPYSTDEIDAASIVLKDGDTLVASALSSPVGMTDHDYDMIPALMVKFDRATVIDYLKSAGKTSMSVEFTVMGTLSTGATIMGNDTVKVISTGK